MSFTLFGSHDILIIIINAGLNKQVRAWIQNYIPLFYIDVITYPYPKLNAALAKLLRKEPICRWWTAIIYSVFGNLATQIMCGSVELVVEVSVFILETEINKECLIENPCV